MKFWEDDRLQREAEMAKEKAAQFDHLPEAERIKAEEATVETDKIEAKGMEDREAIEEAIIGM